jgi:hypothetical protein
VACAGGAWADSRVIGTEDWPYRELDALAVAGLLSGRPTAPLGDWAGDSLTRYEAASLTLRAVEGIGAAYQAEGEKLYKIATAEGSAEEMETPAAPTVSFMDLARVEKLIEEFRTELVTMGARVDDLEAAVKDVQSRLAKVEADQQKHKLDGYLQVRYSDDDGSDSNEFLVRRARFNIRGPVSDRWSYRIEFQLDAREGGLDPTSKTQLRTLYADYKTDAGTLRVGQGKVPWGYELLEDAPDLWTGERALFMDRLFPNQRDIGVRYAYRPGPNRPQFDVGIFNGTGINASDNNKKRNVMARVNVAVPNGSVAFSGYVGERGEGEEATDQDRFGLSARFKWPGGTEFMGEAVTGKNLGADVDGWYAQLGHPISKQAPDLLFVKCDQYDPNTDVTGNLFKRWTLGYWYQLGPATRLTLVHAIRKPEDGFSDRAAWEGERTYVQLQLKY